MNASRDEVVAVLTEAGMDADNVKGWSDAEMAKKLENLPAIKDELAEPEGFKARKLFKALMKGSVTIATNGNGHAEANGHAAPSSTKGKGNAKSEKPRKAQKTKAKGKSERKTDPLKLDKFGSRVGSIQSKINAALNKKAQTMTDLLKRAGVENQQHGYLRELIARKLVMKTDDGYTLTSKGITLK